MYQQYIDLFFLLLSLKPYRVQTPKLKALCVPKYIMLDFPVDLSFLIKLVIIWHVFRLVNRELKL